MDRLAPARSAHRKDVGIRRRGDTGNPPDFDHELPKELKAGFGRNFQRHETDVGDQNPVLTKALVDALEIAKTADEQQRADQQHQRQRDLGDDQNAPQPEALPIGRQPAPTRSHGGCRRGFRRAKGRGEAEQNASEGCHGGSESEHAVVGGQVKKHSVGLGADHGYQHGPKKEGKQDSADRAREGQQQAF